jgi:hypothetical protein
MTEYIIYNENPVKQIDNEVIIEDPSFSLIIFFVNMIIVVILFFILSFIIPGVIKSIQLMNQ